MNHTRKLFCFIDPQVNMMFLIRKGVTLRKTEKTEDGEPMPREPQSGSHEQELKRVLERITKKLNLPSDDENSDEEQDFDD